MPAALRVLEAEGAQIGLQLKMGKCELVVPSGRLSHDARRRFPPGLLTDPATGTDRVGLDGNFEFLGAPVGSPQYCAAFVQRKVDAAAASLQALGELQDPQVGLRLLRLCRNFCKMVYLQRTVPHEVQSAPLQEFDAKIRDAFCSLTGFYPTDEEWKQATRGFAQGGLGLRSAARHAPAAYLASFAATQAGCRELDPRYEWGIADASSWAGRALAALNTALPESTRLITESAQTA